MKNSQLPDFFRDDSESDKVEEVMDYFMSWTLRCAESIYAEKNPLVNKYAKRILSKCLPNNPNMDNKTISTVSVWRQWNRIDLWAEIETEGKKYALIFENKMYAYIREDQLQKYKDIAHKHYLTKNDYEIVFIFLRGDKFQDTDKELCKSADYELLNLQMLKDAMQATEVSGHDLFDEFWFHWWNPQTKDMK